MKNRGGGSSWNDAGRVVVVPMRLGGWRYGEHAAAGAFDGSLGYRLAHRRERRAVATMSKTRR